MADEPTGLGSPSDILARRALFGFALTFILSRVVVFLIMARKIPNLFFFVRGVHVHHLNYGIFLLAAVAGYLLLVRPSGKAGERAALAYGVAMGLTFDEFGMWLHLGGPYWQRISFDAVVTIAALFGLIVYAPDLRRLRPHHWTAAIALLLILVTFIVVLTFSMRFANRHISPILQNIEAAGPAE